MVHGIVDIFKCSYFFSFLRLHVCMFSFSCFPLPVLLWRCFWTIIHELLYSLNRYPPLRFLFVLLNFNCSLSAAHSVYLNFLQLVFICYEGAIASLLWTSHFYFPLKGPLPFQWWKIKWPAQRYSCRIQQRNVLKSHFTVCEKNRW